MSFVGELGAGLAYAALHPQSVRWRDALRVAEAAGVNALPIVALVSFLMGLIMAFKPPFHCASSARSFLSPI